MERVLGCGGPEEISVDVASPPLLVPVPCNEET